MPTMTNGRDLGNGHRWMFDDRGDGMWHNGVCRPWHRVDLTSGTRHRISAGGPDDLDHLTIEGSIMCVCPERSGHHGWVRDGRWVDA